MWSDEQLAEAFRAVASEVPHPWELAGVTYHGESAASEWVAFLYNTETGATGGPEGWGSSPLVALDDLRSKLGEVRSET